MNTQEAYKELGLDPSASDAQLKATWRKLAAAWHPDRNSAKEAASRMQRINKAYQLIREWRDEGGDESAEENAQESAQQSAEPEASAPAQEADASEPNKNKKSHVRKVRLSLEDALHGCTRTVRGHFTHSCTACVGTGRRVLAQACGTCRGSGAVRKPSLFGWMWNQEECEDCGGDGRQRASCSDCEGSGEQSVAYRKQVRFPAGVRQGHVLSLPTTRHGETELDIELQVEIEPHPLFTLDDDGTLRCDMPVNGYAWMTGRWVDVPTPDGLQHMRLNREALTYRLRGQGFPSLPRGPRGDYLVKVQPVFPNTDDPKVEALLDKLIAASTRAAEADKTQAMGEWKRRMKGWEPEGKDAARRD